jgi:bifunctional ADP-heptose synthase (sugar kinase/adenylyltransferase)
MMLLAVLRVVDAIVLLERSELPGSLIHCLRPHATVKGSDYTGKPLDIVAVL